jgi:O-antigen ligase
MNIPFYIICTLIVFTPLARGSVHPWAFTIIQIGILAAAIFCIIEKVSLKKTTLPKTTMTKTTLPKTILPKTPMTRPILLILALCLISTIFSDHKPIAIEGMFMLITYMAAFYITLSCVQTRKQQRILIYTIIATAVLLSLIGILKRFGLTPLPFWLYPDIAMDHTSTSVSGAYVNRNHMAGFLEMAIPFTLVLFITRQRTIETKLGLIVLTLFLFTTQAFTLSRGGWISTINATLFMAAILLAGKNFSDNKIILTIGAGIIIISLFVLASLPVVERITTLTQQDPYDNLSGRIRCWKGAIEQIKDNPYLGTGPNTFAQAYPAWQIPGNAILRQYAHNDYLHFTAETGLLFIPVLIFTLFTFFRTGFQKLKNPSRQTSGFTLGAMAGVFAILIHSFSDFNLNIPANAFLFTVLAAIAARPLAGSSVRPH